MWTGRRAATNLETTGPSERNQTPDPPRDTTSTPHGRHKLSVATGRFSFCHSMLHKSALHRTETRSAPLKAFGAEQLSEGLRLSFLLKHKRHLLVPCRVDCPRKAWLPSVIRPGLPYVGLFAHQSPQEVSERPQNSDPTQSCYGFV